MKRGLVLFALCATARAASADSDQAMLNRVQELLRAHQAEVFACVDKAGQPLDGEMLVRVISGDRGQVAHAEVLKSSATAGASVGPCIIARVRSWDLSSLGMADGDQVVFPLAFKPDAAKAQVEVVSVLPTSRIDCGKAPEQAFYVLDGPVNLNDTMLFAGDVMWLPANQPCTLRPGERAVFKVLRVRSQLPAGSSDPRQPFTVRGKQPAALPILGGKGSVKLYLDGRGASFALDLLSSDSGSKVPAHKHDSSDEFVHIVAGKGTTMVGGKPVAAQTFRIPAGVEHSLTVEEKLTAVQVYAPAGPEQRFKQVLR